MCCSQTQSLTYGSGLQHESGNAEEVDIGIIHSEFYEDCPGVHVNPGAVKQVLNGSVETRIKQG